MYCIERSFCKMDYGCQSFILTFESNWTTNIDIVLKIFEYNTQLDNHTLFLSIDEQNKNVYSIHINLTKLNLRR